MNIKIYIAIITTVLLDFVFIYAGASAVDVSVMKKPWSHYLQKMKKLNESFQNVRGKEESCSDETSYIKNKIFLKCLIPGYFFRTSIESDDSVFLGATIDRKSIGCEKAFLESNTGEGIFEIDLNSGKLKRVISYRYREDAVPFSNDIMMIPKNRRLNFHKMNKKDGSLSGTSLNEDPFFSIGVSGSYQSVGKIDKNHYKVLIDGIWAEGSEEEKYGNQGVSIFDIKKNGDDLTLENGEESKVCRDRFLSLPIMSKDGSKLVAYDLDLKSTVIFNVEDGNCLPEHTLGVATGKADFSYDNKKIAFAYSIKNSETRRQFKNPNIDDSMNIVVYDLESKQMSLMTENNQKNSYFPSFRSDGKINFYEKDKFGNYSIVTSELPDKSKIGNIKSYKCLQESNYIPFVIGDLYRFLCDTTKNSLPSLPNSFLRFSILNREKCEKLVNEKWMDYTQMLSAKSEHYHNLGINMSLIKKIRPSEILEICKKRESKSVSDVTTKGVARHTLSPRKVENVVALLSKKRSLSDSEYLDLKKMIFDTKLNENVRFAIVKELLQSKSFSSSKIPSDMIHFFTDPTFKNTDFGMSTYNEFMETDLSYEYNSKNIEDLNEILEFLENPHSHVLIMNKYIDILKKSKFSLSKKKKKDVLNRLLMILKSLDSKNKMLVDNYSKSHLTILSLDLLGFIKMFAPLSENEFNSELRPIYIRAFSKKINYLEKKRICFSEKTNDKVRMNFKLEELNSDIFGHFLTSSTLSCTHNMNIDVFKMMIKKGNGGYVKENLHTITNSDGLFDELLKTVIEYKNNMNPKLSLVFPLLDSAKPPIRNATDILKKLIFDEVKEDPIANKFFNEVLVRILSQSLVIDNVRELVLELVKSRDNLDSSVLNNLLIFLEPQNSYFALEERIDLIRKLSKAKKIDMKTLSHIPRLLKNSNINAEDRSELLELVLSSSKMSSLSIDEILDISLDEKLKMNKRENIGLKALYMYSSVPAVGRDIFKNGVKFDVHENHFSAIMEFEHNISNQLRLAKKFLNNNSFHFYLLKFASVLSKNKYTNGQVLMEQIIALIDSEESYSLDDLKKIIIANKKSFDDVDQLLIAISRK